VKEALVMRLMDFISAPGLRATPPTFDLDAELRADPDLMYGWRGDDLNADDYAPNPAKFLVADQSGVSPRGEPLFSAPRRSGDDNLALSEDGYLINSQGQFVLGLVLDADGRRLGSKPEILRISAEPVPPSATDWVIYRANLPSFPLTANAEFDVADSELLDKTPYARDPSAQGSGIVLGDDRVKFLARSLSGGSVMVFAREGIQMSLVLRWAKIGSLRSSGCESWNLFYRVRRDPRGGEVAWKNSGHTLAFEADGRLTTTANSIPVFDVAVDGVRLGNISLIFGAGGITQFADRTGLVKVLEASANGSAGGAFAGISMSSRGRLFAHYTDGFSRPVADVHLAEDEVWTGTSEPALKGDLGRRVA
jgi:flagellar hook protein FlgE